MTKFKIVFTDGNDVLHGKILQIWDGYGSYGEALSALRDADLAIPFHWIAKIEIWSEFEASAIEALISHAKDTAEILQGFGDRMTPEALRKDLAKVNTAFGLSPAMVEHAARIFETRHGVTFPGLSEA